MRWIWIDKFIHFESGRRATAIKNVTLAEEHLRFVRVATLLEGWEDHRLQHAARPRAARTHNEMFRTASTSVAGLRSPVQLIFRGASNVWSSKPSRLYSSLIRFVA